MSTSETRTPRKGGLGALIANTKLATPTDGPPAPLEAPSAPAIAPAAAAEPPPATAATVEPTVIPMKVGDVAVATDRRGRQYVQKTCNVPVDLAIWIHDQLGVHHRSEDGAITHRFQDVMIDLLYAGRTALEKKAEPTE